ncbi:MAG: divergent polysaccharide deacetylase family protein, partial [Pseudomonadota bacterium]
PPQISAEVTPSVVPPAEAAPTDLAPSEAAEEAVALATVPPTTSPPPRRRPGLELDLDLEGDAFVQNAVSADVAAEMPIVAVILLVAEDGAAIPSDTLQMQVPIGLAVAPVREDVETLAETARSAGHEVLAAIAPGDRRVASLAGGDIDPTLAALARLPQAIGAMALPGLGTPGQPEDLFEMLAEHGFAYVDPRPLGGGATVRAAAAQGIPSAAISNQAAGQDRASVYRAMQVAAGVARRQGTAILAAAATPEAFAAVAKWQSERGGGRVAIAPVSEVIRRRAR